MTGEPHRLRRTLLFVPANRPDRFAKALATGADVVCIDLEDGVADHDKDRARREATRFLADRGPTPAEIWLRINVPDSDLGRLDLEMLHNASVQPEGLVIPKVANAESLAQLSTELTGALRGTALVPVIESARAMINVEAIAVADAQVSALLFGAIDYSSDIGCAVEWDALLYARSRVVLAAAAAGVDALDAPVMDVSPGDSLAVECHRVVRLGFTGKAAIHPTHVGVIQRAFTPTPQDVTRALRVIAAFEAATNGVVLVDGLVVDRPVITAARRTLRIARASGMSSTPSA